ncbi:unnamed protein product [Diatraea saccharalis]|uniref:Uncharacterized protein n=1 Tax=Diatraea saccharalis TaxID=40085 RepID=A0A9N9RE92_9NEOP|nr:unnamed protein product [Diatraea saccharalis]
MKITMRLRVQTIVVLCTVVLSYANENYENKLTKLWTMSGARKSDGSAILNVTSASIVIQPSSYNNDYAPSRTSRDSRYPNPQKRYAFKPRAIPLRRDEPAQVERSVYYSPGNANKYNPEVLFPGNYFQIAKEKSNKNITEGQGQEVNVAQFHPKAIPLIRSQEFQKRSLDIDTEPIIEKPRDFSEQVASRRSISYLFGEDGDEADEEEEALDELETEEDNKITKGFKHKTPLKPKKTKLKKYVLPLLLAYKMKYFALVPVMIGGLILLIGATGLAGFFFALFAAVMGLQKGGGY